MWSPSVRKLWPGGCHPQPRGRPRSRPPPAIATAPWCPDTFRELEEVSVLIPKWNVQGHVRSCGCRGVGASTPLFLMGGVREEQRLWKGLCQAQGVWRSQWEWGRKVSVNASLQGMRAEPGTLSPQRLRWERRTNGLRAWLPDGCSLRIHHSGHDLLRREGARDRSLGFKFLGCPCTTRFLMGLLWGLHGVGHLQWGTGGPSREAPSTLAVASPSQETAHDCFMTVDTQTLQTFLVPQDSGQPDGLTHYPAPWTASHSGFRAQRWWSWSRALASVPLRPFSWSAGSCLLGCSLGPCCRKTRVLAAGPLWMWMREWREWRMPWAEAHGGGPLPQWWSRGQKLASGQAVAGFQQVPSGCRMNGKPSTTEAELWLIITVLWIPGKANRAGRRESWAGLICHKKGHLDRNSIRSVSQGTFCRTT